MELLNINKINDLGFVFEYGFNLGLYQGFRKYTKYELREVIDKYLEEPYTKGQRIALAIIDKLKITDTIQQEEIINEVYDLIFEGATKGYSTSLEFIKSKFGNDKLDDNNLFKVEYIQFNAANPLSLEGRLKEKYKCKDEYEFYKNCFNLSFGTDISETDYYEMSKKGDFFKADSLILMSKGRRNYLLVIDNKLTLSYSLGVNNPDELVTSLEKQFAHQAKKVKFTNLDENTSELLDDFFVLSSKIIKYAETTKDSSLLKLVQAGSYASSFLAYASPRKLLKKKTNVTLMGYMNNDYSILNLGNIDMNNYDQFKFLSKFKEAYNEWDRTEYTKEEQIDVLTKKQRRLFRDIVGNICKYTNISKEQFKEMDEAIGKSKTFVLEETIEGFRSTSLEFRKKHTELLIKAFKDKDINLIVLNGGPGIGKTTSISMFLKALAESFINPYIAPRKALFTDYMYKFKINNSNDPDYGMFNPKDLICLSVSSTDEDSFEDKPVVNFANNKMIPPKSDKISFLPYNRKIQYKFENKNKFSFNNNRDITKEKELKIGTLNRLALAQKECIEQGYTKIITTSSIQANKKVYKKGKNDESFTTQHFLKVFPFIKISTMGVHNGKYTFNDEDFIMFSKKIKNIIIMIDEITGTDEGVQLFQELNEMLIKPLMAKPYLKEYINIKLIVADASLTNSKVVKQHLKSKKYNNKTIYITSIDEKDKQDLYTDERDNMFLINANSYPAKNLKLRYHINTYLEVIDEDIRDKREYSHKEFQDEDVVKHCLEYLLQEKELQTIIYIQDINRLKKIILDIDSEYKRITGNKESLKEYKDYVIITSRLTQQERDDVIKFNELQSKLDIEEKTLKLIFMTSSASRGISFPDSKSVNCVCPMFSIESAIMEINQVIFRPRGHSEYDTEATKVLDFYIMAPIYASSKDEIDLKKYSTLVSSLTYMFLLRSTILTRIFGYVNIGNSDLAMIALGGVGVYSVDLSFINKVNELINEISKELRSKFENDKRYPLLKSIKEELENMFESLKIETNNQVLFRDNNIKNNSLENIYSNFKHCININALELIKNIQFQDYYVINNLMVFKIRDNTDYINFYKNHSINNKVLMSKLFYILNPNPEDKLIDISDNIRKPMSDIYSFLTYMNNIDENNNYRFLEYANNENRYLAIPIKAFKMYGEFKEKYNPKEEDVYIGDILAMMMRTYSNISSILPINKSKYTNLPFITFKSEDLHLKRDNLFKDNHLMCSTELSILNLLLLSKETKDN